MRIQCPSCKERFSVDVSLLGETVECGACDTRFELGAEHEVISQTSAKHSKGKAGVASFTKSTPSIVQDEAASLRAKAYHQQVDVSAVMPLGLVRILAICFGVVVPLVVVCCFVLGGGSEGFLAEVTTESRWVLAGFGAALSTVLLLYGFVRARSVGVVLAIVSVVGLILLPVQYPYEGVAVDSVQDEVADNTEQASLARYKQELGYQVVESKLAMAQSPEGFVCLVLVGAKPVHLEMVKSYIRQVSGSDEHPNVYKHRRVAGQKATVLLYEKMPMSMDAFAQVTKQFAVRVTQKKALRVVEVVIDEEVLSVPAVEVLNDEEHPSFVKANLQEIHGIDYERRNDAVLRLARSKTIQLRADVEGALIELLAQEAYPHKATVCRALQKWAGGQGEDEASNQAVLAYANEQIKRGEMVSQEALEYLIMHQVVKATPVFFHVWSIDPVVHEVTLVKAGVLGEVALLGQLGNLTPEQLLQSLQVLKKVGGENSLVALRPYLELATGELEKSLKATIDEITSRR